MNWRQVMRSCLAGRPEKILGINIARDSIKIAVLRQGISLTVLDAIQAKLPKSFDVLTAEELADFLHNLLAGKKVFNARKVTVSLSGELIFARSMDFPVLPENELREAIRWEAPQYVPFSAYRTAVMFTESEAAQRRSVCLLAASEANVAKITVMCEKLHWQLASVTAELTAVYRCANIEAGSILLLKAVPGKIQLSLWRDAVPVVIQNIDTAGLNAAGSVDLAARAISETIAGSGDAEQFARVLVYGENACDEIFMQLLENAVPECKIEKIKLQDGVEWGGEYAAPERLALIETDFIAALGGILCSDVNFAQEKGAGKLPKRQLYAVISAVVVTATLAGWLYFLFAYERSVRDLHAAQMEIASLGPLPRQYRASEERAAQIRQLTNVQAQLTKGKLRWGSELEALSAVIPDKAWLTEIKYAEQKNKALLTLTGKALTMQAVETFTARLTERYADMEVRLSSVARERDKRGRCLRYVIVLRKEVHDAGKD